jgi:CRISPR/Cas system-associated protein Cas10 (large subunit of type III CRISPR-Cas system)
MEDRVFNPKEESFSSIEKYEQYRETTRCAICHKKLEKGEIFQLRPIQTPEETGCFDVKAVVVHKQCLEW